MTDNDIDQKELGCAIAGIGATILFFLLWLVLGFINAVFICVFGLALLMLILGVIVLVEDEK